MCINLLRHPAWGRAQETYGEDTFHLGEFGAALTRGVQKPRDGLRQALRAQLDGERPLQRGRDHRRRAPCTRSTCRHFKRAVEEGVASVMSAYNSVNGEWCGQNPDAADRHPQRAVGLRGLRPDRFHLRHARLEEGRAGRAGPGNALRNCTTPRSEEAGRGAGEVPRRARIDDAVLRLLRQQIRFARGANPRDYPRTWSAARRTAPWPARRPKRPSCCCKNAGRPAAARQVQRLAVIGRLADPPNTGDGGSSNTRPAYVITPLQGLQEALGAGVTIVYDDGSDPARARRSPSGADAVVVRGRLHQPG